MCKMYTVWNIYMVVTKFEILFTYPSRWVVIDHSATILASYKKHSLNGWLRRRRARSTLAHLQKSQAEKEGNMG